MKTARILFFLLVSSFLAWNFQKSFEEAHADHPHSHTESGEHSEEESHANDGSPEKESHSHADEEGSGNIGPGKAILEAHEEDGIRLSDKAIKRLKINTTILSQRPFSYPTSALVKHQEETSLYRHRQGWFKLIPPDSEDLKPGDEIVVSGAALLRAAELDAFGEEEGHGH